MGTISQHQFTNNLKPKKNNANVIDWRGGWLSTLVENNTKPQEI